MAQSKAQQRSGYGYSVPPEVAQYIEPARSKLGVFCPMMDRSFRIWPYTAEMIRALMRLEARHFKKLMIFVPPRHGKSTLVSKLFPAWYLGRHPEQRVIHTSYSATLSNFFSQKVRGILEAEPFYKLVFPDTVIPAYSRAVDMWSTTKEGMFLSQGLMGSVTGFGADLFIIDDPVKNKEEADSEVYQDKCYEGYKNVVLTRKEPNSITVLMMTRWNKRDLAGRILENEKDWETVHFRAIDTGVDGEERALCPERFPLEELRKIREDIGVRGWEALYQGNPLAESTQVIKPPWVRWYQSKPETAETRVGGMDTATELKEVNDNTCLVSCYKDYTGDIYVEDVYEGKWAVAETARLTVREHKRDSFDSIRLEKNNAGEAIRQAIMECGIAGGVMLPINAQASKLDKTARLKGVSYLMETGKVFFKQGNERVKVLVSELLDAPQPKHWDSIDALVFALQECIEVKVSAPEPFKTKKKYFDEDKGEYVIEGEEGDEDERWGGSEWRHIVKCKLSY